MFYILYLHLLVFGLVLITPYSIHGDWHGLQQLISNINVADVLYIKSIRDANGTQNFWVLIPGAETLKRVPKFWRNNRGLLCQPADL